jgi:Family of unknown function (DUF6335)
MAAKKAARRSTRRARSTSARPATAARRSGPLGRAKKPKGASKQARKRTPKRPAVKAAAKRTARPKAARRLAPKRTAKPAGPTKAARSKRAIQKTTPAAKRSSSGARATTATRLAAKAALERARRQLPAAERESDQTDARLLSSAKAGGDELQQLLRQHTGASPALTAGDLDANWADAYAVGDEAPGGDNPTPDQDRVDDIGKALGVNYLADEELQSTDKILERDRHRFELDPASADDWPHDN